jgi:hypothetical protein
VQAPPHHDDDDVLFPDASEGKQKPM